jgi:hypothetical protein
MATNRTASTQTVLATFSSNDQRESWTYKFQKFESGWLIEDVLHDGASLSQTMRNGCSN